MRTTLTNIKVPLALMLSTLLIGLAGFMAACTNRVSAGLPINMADLTPQQLNFRGFIAYQGQPMNTFQLQEQNGYLFATGTPFDFIILNISTDPENPVNIADAKSQMNLFSPDPPFGGWSAASFGSTALSIDGQYAVMSGSMGASVVDFQNIQNPQEIIREPPPTSNLSVYSDSTYMWNGVVALGSLVFGFQMLNYNYVFGPLPQSLGIIGKNAYSTQSVCCVMGATYFAPLQQIFVAFRNQLVAYGLQYDSSGNFQNLYEVGAANTILAAYVTSSPHLLYVLHEPLYSGISSPYPAGIYVYSSQYQLVGYLPLTPRVFAVSDDDSHLYATDQNGNLSIYAINGAP